MRIGELARRAGVSVRSLRYYEEQGLVLADRTSGGHREYEESDVDRVVFVQCMFSAGLPSSAILHLLPFLDTGVATAAMRRRLDDEHDRIQQRIEELTVARDRLAGLRQVASEVADAGGDPARSGEPASSATSP
jgi:DNA-binding transcriptional MerR regulator